MVSIRPFFDKRLWKPRTPPLAPLNWNYRGCARCTSSQKFAETLAARQALLAGASAPRDPLLFAAIAQRIWADSRGIARRCEAWKQHHPRFSRLHEERGRCYVDLRQAPQAIEAFCGR